jgi:hypothetical protein
MPTRFLFVVLGAYQQMHLQQFPVRTVSEVNAKNFDDAFTGRMFHPSLSSFLSRMMAIMQLFTWGEADAAQGITRTLLFFCS